MDIGQGKIRVKESREVRELRGRILGMEMELNILSRDLDAYKAQLLYNLRAKKQVDENIHFLKTSKAAVSLSEYRKIKQQKNLVDMRIKYYKQKIQPLEQILNRKEDYHKKEIERFHEVYRMQFTNNILEFPNVRKKA